MDSTVLCFICAFIGHADWFHRLIIYWSAIILIFFWSGDNTVWSNREGPRSSWCRCDSLSRWSPTVGICFAVGPSRCQGKLYCYYSESEAPFTCPRPVSGRTTLLSWVLCCTITMSCKFLVVNLQYNVNSACCVMQCVIIGLDWIRCNMCDADLDLTLVVFSIM